MSEEKKPTDEEIAKAILQQIEYNAGIPYINEWQQVKTIKFTEILDLIRRLQNEKAEYERKLADGELVSKDWHDEQVLHAEEQCQLLLYNIEELQGENAGLKERGEIVINSLHETIDKQKAEIERLKINLANEKKWGKIQSKKTEKETARLILDELDLFFKGTTFRQGYEFKKINEKLKEMAKKYDVGVDYEN